MKRSALVLLVAGIVGVLIFLATRTNGSRGAVLAPPPKAEVVQAQRVPELIAPAVERTEVAPSEARAEPAAAGETGWRVCVLDGSTQAAVTGARVSVTDWDALRRALAAEGVGLDTLAGQRLRLAHSVEARTGADGCVFIATPPVHALVEARSRNDWATEYVFRIPEENCVTLKLGPDRVLEVRVVDAAGSPVGGVPVALRRPTEVRPFDFKWTDTEARTGVAAFLHFQRRLAQGIGWQVLLAFPVRDQRSIPVDGDTPIEPPLTLVLSDTGRVRVRVRALDGGIPDLQGVELHLDASEQEGAARLWPDGPWAQPKLDAAGEALVPWIGLGLQLKVALLEQGQELVARSIAGPVRAGEELLCEIVLPRATPTFVTGRFVLRDGRPWPGGKVNVFTTLFPISSRMPRMRPVDVDAAGRFRMPVLEARPANGTRTLNVHGEQPYDHGQMVVDIPLDQDVPPAGLDLGDVLFDYGELLVSGRIVDSARRPLKDAFSLVLTRRALSHGEAWPPVRTAGRSATAENGEFAIYLAPGEPPPTGELRLATHAQGYVTEDQREIRRGERNVEVVLARAGALAGSLALDPGLPQADLELVLSSEEREVLQLRPDSTFEATGLQPGTYSFAVRIRGADERWEREPATHVEDLLVLAGETCRDPRIQSLRIANVLPSLRIRVVDRASKPIENAGVSIARHRDKPAALSGTDGLCVVRSQTLPVDLEVSAFGYLRQSLPGVDADREVVLETGYPIRLHTSTKPGGSNPNYSVNLHLSSLDPNGNWVGPVWGSEFWAGSPIERYQLDERGELALRMPAAGLYECQVGVTVLRGDGMFSGGGVELPAKPRFRVIASDTEQLFEISIPPEAIQAAVEAALK